MKHSKLSCLLLAALLCLSLLAGCGNTNSSQTPGTEPSAGAGSATDPIQSAADENEAAAEQLLQDLRGTYQELWPVVLADEYHQTWWTTASAWWVKKTLNPPLGCYHPW